MVPQTSIYSPYLMQLLAREHLLNLVAMKGLNYVSHTDAIVCSQS